MRTFFAAALLCLCSCDLGSPYIAEIRCECFCGPNCRTITQRVCTSDGWDYADNLSRELTAGCPFTGGEYMCSSLNTGQECSP